ncbi:ISAs1-like element ISEc26 family transposase [soil metagenome]
MTKSARLSPTSIHQFFASLPEPRQRRTRIKHPLLSLVIIALCGTIAGADTWEEIVQFARDRRQWLSGFLDLSQGIPSHDTFGRVFAALDPVAFQKCLLAWVQRLHEVTQGQVIAIDGKVVREAMARAGDQGPLTLVSAWATANHVCLGQVAGAAGSNELGALPKLLELLDLKGAIVTLDALGCQKDLVAQIVEKEGDYVVAVKGNQEKLKAAVQVTLGTAMEAGTAMPTITRVEQKHGRAERRLYTVLPVPDDFAELMQWKGLKSLVMVARESVDAKGKTHTGVRYYISSLPAEVKRIAAAVRGHWGIENRLHWVLDVAFREDRNRTRARNAQANLGILRRTALSLLKNTDGLKGSVHCRRQQAAWNDETLGKILFGCQGRET